MIYKKELLILISIIISTGAKIFSPISYEVDKTVAASVRNVRKAEPLKDARQLVKNVDFPKLFKSLRRNHSPEEVRIVGTIGLLAGALHAEEAMRENLYHMTDDLLDTFNKSTPKENMHKLLAIEETINRDKSAISILNGMLRYARNGTTLNALEKDMHHILHENEASSKRLRSKKLALGIDDEIDGQKSASTGKLITRSGMNLKYSVKEKLYDVREMIDNHVENIHSSVTDNVKQTIKFVQKMQKTNEKLSQTNTKQKVKLDPSLIPVRRLWDQIASPENTGSDFDVDLNYHQEPGQAFRIVEMARLTKGEELVVVTSKPKAVLVNTKLDRFKRHDRRSDPDMSFVVDVDVGFGGPKMNDRQDDDDKDNEIDGSKSEGEKEMNEQNEEEFDESSSPSDEPGGLVGLITNLSGVCSHFEV
ncbi:uncharacterized protein LOC129565823 [Sitodiplosis mosellana]|uniref:uncharacterized protein LOC129565823 n=1 Tax=Sitodiplosis mosellana TaxID=263140 RepID=UPI002443CBD3|nr:uncharacterized protein LOC129565823 [Sitodiplosis mosellana]